jgi:hypothetical protein
MAACTWLCWHGVQGLYMQCKPYTCSSDHNCLAPAQQAAATEQCTAVQPSNMLSLVLAVSPEEQHPPVGHTPMYRSISAKSH